MRKKEKILNPGWKWYWKLWKTFEPPYIPSGAEIEFWEKAVRKIAKRKNCRALVIGVTPEIRDLLSKHKIEVILVDINPVMYKAMNKLIKLKNPKEKFIKTNWLEMDKVLPKNYFDIVLSDSPHGNIRFSEFDKFNKNIHLILKRKGIFCLGAATVESRDKGISYETLIKIYKKDPLKFKKFKWQRYYVFKTGFKDKKVFDRKNFGFKEGIFDKKIEEYFKKGKITKHDLEYLRFNEGDYTGVFPTPAVFHKILRKYFKISKYFIDPVSKKYPIMKYKKAYLLKKK